jgi:hypothetical protein
MVFTVLIRSVQIGEDLLDKDGEVMDKDINICLTGDIFDLVVKEEDEFLFGFIDLDVGLLSTWGDDEVCGIDDIAVIIEVVDESETG